MPFATLSVGCATLRPPELQQAQTSQAQEAGPSGENTASPLPQSKTKEKDGLFGRQGTHAYDSRSSEFPLSWPNEAEFNSWFERESSSKCIELLRNLNDTSKGNPPRYKWKRRFYCSRDGTRGGKSYLSERKQNLSLKRLPGGCPCLLIVKAYFDTEEIRGSYVDQHSHAIGEANRRFIQRSRGPPTLAWPDMDDLAATGDGASATPSADEEEEQGEERVNGQLPAPPTPPTDDVANADSASTSATRTDTVENRLTDSFAQIRNKLDALEFQCTDRDLSSSERLVVLINLSKFEGNLDALLAFGHVIGAPSNPSNPLQPAGLTARRKTSCQTVHPSTADGRDVRAPDHHRSFSAHVPPPPFLYHGPPSPHACHLCPPHVNIHPHPLLPHACHLCPPNIHRGYFPVAPGPETYPSHPSAMMPSPPQPPPPRAPTPATAPFPHPSPPAPPPLAAVSKTRPMKIISQTPEDYARKAQNQALSARPPPPPPKSTTTMTTTSTSTGAKRTRTAAEDADAGVSGGTSSKRLKDSERDFVHVNFVVTPDST